MGDLESVAEGYLIESEFLEELKANGMSDKGLLNYRSAVESLSITDKDPRKMEKKDLIKWSASLSDRYEESTANRYRAYVKRYFKWLRTGEMSAGDYPDCVKWIRTGGRKKNLPKEILSRNEIERIARAADKQRDETLVWMGYESGARPSELLGLKIRDVEFDRYGAQIIVDGKTGERRIRLVESVYYLKSWLEVHPEGSDPNSCLFRSQKGGALRRYSWSRTLKKLASKAGIRKRVHPHLLRHSRATHLAAHGVNEAQLREIFGWTKNSDMPSVYVHLSGRDTDATILKLNGIDVKARRNQLGTSGKRCRSCGHYNSLDANYCSRCGQKLGTSSRGMTRSRIKSNPGEDQGKLAAKITENVMDELPRVLREMIRVELANMQSTEEGYSSEESRSM